MYGSFYQYKSHESQWIAKSLVKEGKPEDNSLAAMTGSADTISYEEEEDEPETECETATESESEED